MHSPYRYLRAAPIAALALLAACNSQPETVVSSPADPDAGKVAAAPAVTLPPALIASHTYRCKDNSVIYVDFFEDKKTADLKTKDSGPATRLTAAEVGAPFAADGYSVNGSGHTITYQAPGKSSQSCKA
jgi:hypothetical protein